ncbi:MAG: hypothetical protein HKN85_03535 [Gammaproteobacteria bacterium]|nr:hypothetical protein [Gammaproteobacteria bacterium]
MKYIKQKRGQSGLILIAAVLFTGSVHAATIHTGNNSHDGSLCVGFDCIANENFGFDTLRLKENNLRLHFDDTSSTSSFPNNDWRLIANDSTNGGANRFSIQDATAGRAVFTVTAGARTNALFVDSQGDVGLGTNTPALDIDIKTGDSPGVRLQQDGSSGFTPQTWDVSGNETNFFIRDASNGSQLPFRIKPGADSNSIFIAADNDVGIGTSAPVSRLHVPVGTITTEALTVTDAIIGDIEIRDVDQTKIAMENNAFGTEKWQIIYDDGGEFRLSRESSGGVEMRLTSSGDLTVRGEVFSSTCGTPCAPDYVFADDYELMPLESLADFIEQENHLPNVPSAEELTGPISINKLQMSLLEKIEELTLYTLQQQERIERLEQLLEEK